MFWCLFNTLCVPTNLQHDQTLVKLAVWVLRSTNPRMDRHANNRPLKKSSKDAATVAMINLEADSFKLLENRVEYDLQCLRVARHRMETYEGALYHQQLTHRKHAFEVSESAVHSFFEANVKLVCSTKPSDVVCLYDRFELDFSKNYGLPKENMATQLRCAYLFGL